MGRNISIGAEKTLINAGKFVRGTTITFTTGIMNFLLGIGTSIILARSLGPEGKGVYTLVTLLPSFIVSFGNLGIGPATVFYVAREEFRRLEILGNNVLLGLGIGAVGIIAGLIMIVFFQRVLFPGIAQHDLLLALMLVPVELLFTYTQLFLLGMQKIKKFNYIAIVQAALFLGFIIVAVIGLKSGVTGAIASGLVSWLIVLVIVLRWAKQAAGGIDYSPNAAYIKGAINYGFQAHLSNILGFLNYRVDIFLINGFLGQAAVGLYSLGVGLVEKLWMISQAASTILLPRVAAETDEQKRKEFTPLVARTVLWGTALGAVALFFMSRWIVILLYSRTFLPAVGALQALLAGIIALSAGRVLSNDIAGRGRPILNVYTGVATVFVNVILNLLWIPRYGIPGAAYASTVSYIVSFFGALFFYCRLSGNYWTKMIIPQPGDWVLYKRMGNELYRWVWAKVKM